MIRCIILAAGQGKRLRPLTKDRPKGLVPLLNKPLIYHQIETLNGSGIDKIAIVTGYQAKKLSDLGLPTFHNSYFNSTNMVESLFTALPFFASAQTDLLISYGDIVYEKANLERVLKTEGDIVVMVDDRWLDLWSIRNEDPLNDAETLKLDEGGYIYEIGQKPQSLSEIEGQYTGLIKISRKKISDFIAVYQKLNRSQTYNGRPFKKMYMTYFLQLLIDAGWLVTPAHVQNGWLEVDTVSDIKLYERLWAEKKLSLLWKPI